MVILVQLHASMFDGQNKKPGAVAPTEIFDAYFDAMAGLTQPFFITLCEGRKLR
jgi:hypothetical protein